MVRRGVAGVEPKPMLLRRRQAIDWLGLKTEEFDKLVKAGVVPYKTFGKGMRRFYLKEDIRRIFLSGYEAV